ncbi:MAG: hypothetical protein L3J38_01540 [Thiomicrorhabdus sp.]|nr:hypothetical protein [Thiomicrorhabdus sp.]
MFYFKRLVHSLFALTIIIGLSACSPNTPTKTTKEANKVAVQKVVKETPKTKAKAKAKNETLIKVDQQLDELFTPVIGLF